MSVIGLFHFFLLVISRAPTRHNKHIYFTLIYLNASWKWIQGTTCIGWYHTYFIYLHMSPDSSFILNCLYSCQICLSYIRLELSCGHNISLLLHNHEPPQPWRQLHLTDIYHYHSHPCLPFIWKCFRQSLHLFLFSRHYLPFILWTRLNWKGWLVIGVWGSFSWYTPSKLHYPHLPLFGFSPSLVPLPSLSLKHAGKRSYIKILMDLPHLDLFKLFCLTCRSLKLFLLSALKFVIM